MDKTRNIGTSLLLCLLLPIITEQNRVNVKGKVIVGDHIRRVFNDVWDRVLTQHDFKASSVDNDLRYNNNTDTINGMKSFEEMSGDEISVTNNMENNKQFSNRGKVKSDPLYIDFNSILNALYGFFEHKTAERKGDEILPVKNHQPTILVKGHPNKERENKDLKLIDRADKTSKADDDHDNLKSFDDEIIIKDIGRIKFNIDIDASDEDSANLKAITDELRAKNDVSSNETNSDSYEIKQPEKDNKSQDKIFISPLSINKKTLSVHNKGQRKKKISTSTMRNWNNIKI